MTPLIVVPRPSLSARENTQLRRKRMAEARARGRHTIEEWRALCAEFDHRCVRCGSHESEFAGGLTRDHIVPVRWDGSDAIDNIQPMCQSCNSAKAGYDCTDYKAYRRRVGFNP